MQRAFLALLALSPCASISYSSFTVARSFGEHAVLQSAPASARVWGWTDPLGIVEVVLNCSVIRVAAVFNTTADTSGLWVAAFPPVPPSNHPCAIKFTDVGSSVAAAYADILFGTVLLCGGQSNMDLPTSYIVNASAELAYANAFSNYVRFLHVPCNSFGTAAGSVPLRDFSVVDSWALASNYTAASFSAECWLAARDMYKAGQADKSTDGIPVGAIQADWPGTHIVTHSSAAALAQCGGAPPMPPNTNNASYPYWPSALHNAMIAPLTVGPLAVSAFVWHQGEADVHNPDSATAYECRLRALAADWRATMGAWPGAYFGITLLAPYAGDCGAAMDYGCATGVATVRAAQLRVGLSMPNASAAVSTDLGDPQAPAGSVHSRRKAEIGARLAAGFAAARWGSASVSGPVYGPLYSHATDASGGSSLAADVSFTPSSCAAGLQLVFGEPWTSECPVNASASAPDISECAWFAIQGSSSGWHNATVTILNGTTVRLTVTGNATGTPGDYAMDTAIATAFGQGAYPVTVLFSGTLPVAPWNATI